MGSISTVRAWDDLSADQRVALENAVVNALIASAKVDIPTGDVDVRDARITADIGVAGTTFAQVTANVWNFAFGAPGTLGSIIIHQVTQVTNVAIWGFTCRDRAAGEIQIVQSNGTTLAIDEINFVNSNEHPLGYFSNAFIFTKNEGFTISIRSLDLLTHEFVVRMKIAEQAGTLIGCKV